MKRALIIVLGILLAWGSTASANHRPVRLDAVEPASLLQVSKGGAPEEVRVTLKGNFDGPGGAHTFRDFMKVYIRRARGKFAEVPAAALPGWIHDPHDSFEVAFRDTDWLTEPGTLEFKVMRLDPIDFGAVWHESSIAQLAILPGGTPAITYLQKEHIAIGADLSDGRCSVRLVGKNISHRTQVLVEGVAALRMNPVLFSKTVADFQVPVAFRAKPGRYSVQLQDGTAASNVAWLELVAPPVIQQILPTKLNPYPDPQPEGPTAPPVAARPGGPAVAGSAAGSPAATAAQKAPSAAASKLSSGPMVAPQVVDVTLKFTGSKPTTVAVRIDGGTWSARPRAVITDDTVGLKVVATALQGKKKLDVQLKNLAGETMGSVEIASPPPPQITMGNRPKPLGDLPQQLLGTEAGKPISLGGSEAGGVGALAMARGVQIREIKPSSITRGGGPVAVQISGTGFRTNAGLSILCPGAAVTGSSPPALCKGLILTGFQVTSPTTATATLTAGPAAVPGQHVVVVKNPDNTSNADQVPPATLAITPAAPAPGVATPPRAAPQSPSTPTVQPGPPQVVPGTRQR